MISPVKLSLVVVGIVLVSGCAGQTRTEADYGKAARSMVEQQKMTPVGTLKADEPLKSTDGRRMANVLEVYQTNVGDPEAVVRSKKVGSGAAQ